MAQRHGRLHLRRLPLPRVLDVLHGVQADRRHHLGDPVWFPTNITFEHFKTATDAEHFWTFVRNSLTVTCLAVLFSLIIALAGSFALARMRFKGRRGFIIGFMLAQMAPWEVMVIAIYMIVRDSSMLNSLVPLTAFYMMMILPFTILTLRGFVAAVPKELEESAMVDGCTRAQAFRRVILPLLAPGLMSTSMFGFITAWNEFPLVLVLSKESGARRRCRCGCPASRPSSATTGARPWPPPRSSPSRS
ncbi:hypothetical protein SHKM778_26510 [Streptomyces sp. KM77-8]|uniref:ABC transmembrane type-1 domain-containing protein n=1 Tax=Streptomyces haneummycinicus TaxID=3074435 RepID=A0AAT9HFK0_9ACTN